MKQALLIQQLTEIVDYFDELYHWIDDRTFYAKMFDRRSAVEKAIEYIECM